MKETFGLYLILTDPVAGYEACAQSAVDCGVRYLQLRMKNTPHESLLETAQRLRIITRNSQTRFIINDNLAVAIESDADGIHLGQDDMPLNEARKKWNAPDKIFGLSTHNDKQVEQAKQLNPDYIGIGPVFPTPSKPGHDPALGIDVTSRMVKNTPLTSVAIGGINNENLPSILNAGITNYCVVRAVNAVSDPLKAIRELQKIDSISNFKITEPEEDSDCATRSNLY